MYDLVDTIETWRQAGTRGVIARTLSLSGFGSRTDGEVLALSASGSQVGSLLSGAGADELKAEAQQVFGGASAALRKVVLKIGDREAIAAGLACGGVAQVVLQSLGSFPEEAWAAFKAGKAVALVTELVAGATVTYQGNQLAGGTLGSTELDEVAAQQAAEMLSLGKTGSRVIEHEKTSLFLETFVPHMQLLVVGTAILADALRAQGESAWLADQHRGHLGRVRRGHRPNARLGRAGAADPRQVNRRGHSGCRPAAWRWLRGRSRFAWQPVRAPGTAEGARCR